MALRRDTERGPRSGKGVLGAANRFRSHSKTAPTGEPGGVRGSADAHLASEECGLAKRGEAQGGSGGFREGTRSALLNPRHVSSSTSKAQLEF
jgi:hypothetical protein